MMMIFAAAMALIVQTGEWLAMPMPEGFVVGYTQSAQAGSIEERIPKGETVERWTRMITLITINSDMEPGDYADAFESRLIAACPNAVLSPPVRTSIGSHTAVGERVDCPRNPQTGKPETFLYRVIGSGGRLYMVQVAFRSVPDAKQSAWAEAQLDSALLCPTDSIGPPCKP